MCAFFSRHPVLTQPYFKLLPPFPCRFWLDDPDTISVCCYVTDFFRFLGLLKFFYTTQIRPSAPSSVISRPTCFSSSLRCCMQVGSAPFVRRRCDCLASSAPFTNIQTYLLTDVRRACTQLWTAPSNGWEVRTWKHHFDRPQNDQIWRVNSKHMWGGGLFLGVSRAHVAIGRAPALPNLEFQSLHFYTLRRSTADFGVVTYTGRCVIKGVSLPLHCTVRRAVCQR